MRALTKLAVALAVVTLAGAGAVATASTISRGLVPGHTIRDFQFAAGGLGDANGNFVQVGLQTGAVSFRTKGGGTVIEDGSTVTAQAFTADGLFAFGCWTVPSTMIDFNINTGVTLRFDSRAQGVSECPGTPFGPAISAVPAPTSLQDSVFGFAGPVIVMATWTPAGPLDVRSTTINTTCGGFRALDHQDTRHFGSGPVLTVTAMTVEGTNPSTGLPEDVDLSGFHGIPPAFGDVSEMTENLVVNATASAVSCGQFGS